MKNALIILAQHGYQDVEYAGTRNGLEDAGYQIAIASTQAGKCHGKFGGIEMASAALNDVDVIHFDIIAFVGGPGAAALADDDNAKRIARDAVHQGKKLGAICIAPLILARAGVLKGMKATVWESGSGEESGIITAEGGEYTGEDVTIDGNIITANGPHAAEEFGRVFGAM